MTVYGDDMGRRLPALRFLAFGLGFRDQKTTNRNEETP